MQNNIAANSKRREKDVMKLIMSGKFQVHLTNEDSTNEFEVLFEGPYESLYQGVSILVIDSLNAMSDKMKGSSIFLISIFGLI